MKIRMFVFLIACFYILFGIKSGLAQVEAVLIQEGIRKWQEQGLTTEEIRRKAKEKGITEEQLRKYAEEANIQIPQEPQEAIIEETREQAKEAGIEVSKTEKVAKKTVEDTLPEGEKIKPEEPEELSYFGYDLFKDIPDAFKPSPIGPINEGYVIGPGDELILTLWGATELRRVIQVDPEGRILLENVGQRMVAGERLIDLRQEMKVWLSQAYSGLTANPPKIMMDLTVARLRPIQIYVLGELDKPGGYKVSSNSTPFNAIYSVGGPKTSGSLRKIQIIRSGKKQVDTVDFYNDLLKGYNPHDIHLCDNDRIHIPLRGKTVSISGKVKRPAIYELLDGENLSDLLEYCGGLTADAYTKRLQIERILPPEEREDASIARKIIDVSMKEVLFGERDVGLVDGDKIKIFSILDPLQNAASIKGAVQQPGRYQISDSVRTVKDLILQADSLKGNAYLEKAKLIRINEDSTEKFISLNLRKVMADFPLDNIPLLPKDELYVYSIRELEAEQKVSIEGNVRNPGIYPLRDSMKVYDLLFEGGGLTDEEFLKEVYLERADLFRKTPDGKEEIVVPFHLGKALNKGGFADTLLRPKDRIQVYSNFVDEMAIEKFVYISGAVKDPGKFNLQENMTLEDLIIRAGGFTEGADVAKAEISRILEDKREVKPNQKSLNFVVRLKEDGNLPISFVMDDTLRFSREAQIFLLKHRDKVYIRTNPDYQPQETVEIKGEVYYPGEYVLQRENETLSSIVQRAGGIKPTAYPKGGRLFRQENRLITRFDKAVQGVKRADVILSSGDSIVIPQIPNTVEVRGDISNEGLLKYEKKRHASYYIRQAGGTEERVKNIYLTQANGSSYSLKRGLLPNKNPKVDDGAVITIIQKTPREKEKFDLGKTITDVASVTSTILLLVYLINVVK